MTNEMKQEEIIKIIEKTKTDFAEKIKIQNEKLLNLTNAYGSLQKLLEQMDIKYKEKIEILQKENADLKDLLAEKDDLIKKLQASK